MSSVLSSADHSRRAAATDPRGTTGVDRRPKLATYLSAGIIVVVVTGFAVTSMVNFLSASVGFMHGAYGIVALAALMGIQLAYFSRPAARLGSTTSWVLFAALVVLGFVPVLTFGLLWTDMLVFAAGTTLLMLPHRYAWPVVIVVFGGCSLWIYRAFGASALDTLYEGIGVVFYGLIFYLLSRLARMVDELHRARTELAQRAVAEQRLAFARDLHDLLGLSLSSIALRGELVHRLMRKSIEQAKAELAEITAIAQRTLTDVRAVSHGYLERSLEKESRTAESLLAASEIAVQVHLDSGDLPVQARTMLGKVLREGVTNVLRYSNVEHCEINVHQDGGTVVLEIVNDGVAADDLPLEPGSRLTRLPDEVAALGGRATAEAGPDGRFLLRVELPVPTSLSGPAAGLDQREPPTEAKRVGRLLSITFGLMGVLAVVHLLHLTTTGWRIALVVGSISALLALQFSYFDRPTALLRSAQSYGMVFVQLCLVYLPLLALGRDWVSLPGLLIGSALLVMPPALGWPFFALNVAAFAWIEEAVGVGTRATVFYTAATLMTGLTVFGLLWLVRLVAELDGTRRRLAEMAVAEERLRFARDLHDLLGMSLSAIALKSELTSRLLPLDAGRATDELLEVLGLTRQALADVRSVASGYRELSLDAESRSAQSVLAAADVRVRMEMLEAELPPAVRTVLAVVLREGVTNVLRHSKVECCEIAMRRTAGGICLDILNDGVSDADVAPEPAPSARRRTSPGSGIGNLSHRVTGLGGELSAGVEADGRFRLRAVVPV